jgi:hypothetical protein
MKNKRELTLPILPRVTATKPAKRAARDLSAAAFARALARNGFRAVQGGTHFVDTAGGFAERIPGVFRADPIRLHRRATLARIIRARTSSEPGVRIASESQEEKRYESIR